MSLPGLVVIGMTEARDIVLLVCPDSLGSQNRTPIWKTYFLDLAMASWKLVLRMRTVTGGERTIPALGNCDGCG